MALEHGVRAKEIATSIIPGTPLADGIPVFIGTAPVQQKNIKNANQAVLCYTADDFVNQFGYSDDWEKYTLCEAYYAAFKLYQVAPIAFINVLDFSEHKAVAENEKISFLSGKATLPAGVVTDTLIVKSEDTVTTYQVNIDYVLSYSDEGDLLLLSVDGGSLTSSVTALAISYQKLDPKMVTKGDIIGGIDLNTGRREGLELINEVFIKYKKVPGSLGAPGFSQDSEVGVIMAAKMELMNGVFKGQMAAVDLDTAETTKYSNVPAAKSKNNFFDPLQTVCWPMGKLGDRLYHLSTLVICRKAAVDLSHDGIPYESPSNKSAGVDSCVLKDGTEITLEKSQANYLNENGVVTLFNFVNGWVIWGNRTAAYPGITDPKEVFIPMRAMMSWWGNYLILSFWQKVDQPMNRRLIANILDSTQLYINGLIGAEAIAGGEVRLLESENPITDIINGKIAFHTYLGFLPPAEDIVFNNEFEPSFLQSMFAEFFS